MSLLKDIWSAVSGIGKGMEKTYDEQFDPIFTEMYPFDMPKLPPTSVQSLALIKNEDGSDRCVSCLACEKVCPSQVITIERKKNPAGKGFVLERFDIDLVNCMYCAACVESCPASAIVTIQDFEMSTPNLQTLKADKDFLDFQGIRAQQWYSPKIGVEYRENVSASNIHGSIVKAPLMDQPGGIAELEKLKAAGTEIPVNNARRPANAMSELSVLEYKQLKHEPISAPALKLENTAPVAVQIPVSTPAPALETVAATVPAVPSAPKSKKIKRWGEPASEDSSQPAAVAPVVAPNPNPLVEGVGVAGGSSPAEAAVPKAEAVAVAPPSSDAPVASSPEAPAEEKPRNPKIKRWEPKS
jgi:NADH-quinone oxidoreductase subunit I